MGDNSFYKAEIHAYGMRFMSNRRKMAKAIDSIAVIHFIYFVEVQSMFEARRDSKILFRGAAYVLAPYSLRKRHFIISSAIQ